MYNFAFTRKCYRIVETITQETDGEFTTYYTVQQLHKLFRLKWWSIVESPTRYTNGSVFCSKTDATVYISSRVFNSTPHIKVHAPVCYEEND